MRKKTKKMKGLMAILITLAMVLSLFGGITFVPITAHAEGIVGTVVKEGDTFDFGGSYVAWDNTGTSYIFEYQTITVSSITRDDFWNQWKFVTGTLQNLYLTAPASRDPLERPNGFKVVGGSGTELDPYTLELVYGDYTVTYDANGADDGSVPTDVSYSYYSGESVTVRGNTGDLKKNLYQFGGWNTKADGSGTTYAAGDTFNITKDMVLYAKWDEKTLNLVDKVVKMGDTIDFDGMYILSDDNSGNSFPVASFTLTGINWIEGYGQWKFEADGASIYISGTNDKTATGFKVSGGNGKPDNPYTFEAVYEAITHTHTLVKIDEVSATCTEDGTREYWKCSECNKLFSDSDATHEINAPTEIPSTGHDWGEWVVTKEATATEDGSRMRVCKNNPSHKETEVIEKTSHIHTIVKVDAAPATCTEDGHEAYWMCSLCTKMFSDANGVNEINSPTLIPAIGHDWGDWVVTKEATTTEDGLETRICKNDASHVENRSIKSGNSGNGDWSDDFTGLFPKGENWYYVENGVWISDKYAFIEYKGYKFIVANGLLAKVNGLVMDPNSDKWYFCAEGQVVKHTGLVMYDDEWFYVEDGVLDTGLNALVEYNGGLFYVAAGRLLRNVNGLVMDPNSPDWYFVAIGEVQVSYTGLAYYNGEWFYVAKGRLAVEYSGEMEYDGQIFKVENGMVK